MRSGELGLFHVKVMMSFDLDVFERFALLLIVGFAFLYYFGRVVIMALLTLEDF